MAAERQRLRNDYEFGVIDDATYDSARDALDEEEMLQSGRSEVETEN